MYPILLPPAVVYPDVEPSFREPPDAYEAGFRRIPVISELLMQKMGSGAVQGSNPFTDLLDNPFANKAYNDESLDREIYAFKAEWDRVLAAEGAVSFAAPQLRDILASEIDYIKRNNFPLFSAEASKIDADELAQAARVMLRTYGERGFRGLGCDCPDSPWWNVKRLGATDVVNAAANAARTVGEQPVSRGREGYNDSIMSVFQAISPYIELALKVLSNVVTAVVSIATQVATGVELAQAVVMAQASVVQGITSAVSSFVEGQVTNIAIDALLHTIMGFMKCVAKWQMLRARLKALGNASREIRQAFHDLALEIVKAMRDARDNTDNAMANFRIIMAEMIARIHRGEHIIGFLNCKSDGTMVIEFGIDKRFLPTDRPAAVGGMTGRQKAIVLAAGVGALALARAR